MPTAAALTRGELLARNGCLTIVRQPLAPVKPAPGQPGSGSSYVQDTPEIFVAVLHDGRILAFNRHVDRGAGIRNSLAQIGAGQVDVAAERDDMSHCESAVGAQQW